MTSPSVVFAKPYILIPLPSAKPYAPSLCPCEAGCPPLFVIPSKSYVPIFVILARSARIHRVSCTAHRETTKPARRRRRHANMVTGGIAARPLAVAKSRYRTIPLRVPRSKASWVGVRWILARSARMTGFLSQSTAAVQRDSIARKQYLHETTKYTRC
jgi:hypothetical protein